MHWLSENYKWLFDGVAGAAIIAVIGFLVHRFLGPKDQQETALTARGAKVTNSPVASGTNISQTINSPTLNLSLPAPTSGTPGRERYDEWRELIDEIHESIEQMSYAFMPLVPVKPGDERNDYQAGIRRGNRVLGNRILIADAVQKAGLKKDWDELVQYTHSARGPINRWQQGSPTMGGFDNNARQFREKLMRIAREDIDAYTFASPDRQQLTLRPSIALPILLEKVLRSYPGRHFSPYFIRNWGSRQLGFEQLASFSKEEITQSLLIMLAENQVRTGISKKGNTLYYIPR